MPAAVTISLFVFLLISLAAIFLLCGDDKYPFLKKIHREHIIGSIISTSALAWAGFQGYELLGQDFPAIASIIPILVPALIIGVFFLMDYIFTRAVGGLLIMLICDLFYISQETEMPARFLFSLCGYIITVAGMYMIGPAMEIQRYAF